MVPPTTARRAGGVVPWRIIRGSHELVVAIGARRRNVSEIEDTKKGERRKRSPSSKFD